MFFQSNKNNEKKREAKSPPSFGNNPIAMIDKRGEKKTIFMVIVDERTGGTITMRKETAGLLAYKTTDYYSGHSSWNWFDYSQTYTFTRHKDGTVTYSESEPTYGKYRTNTYFNNIIVGESWARTKVGEPEDNNQVKDHRKYDGWALTSSGASAGLNNAYEPTAGSKSVMFDVDVILGAMNTISNLHGETPKGNLDWLMFLEVILIITKQHS